MNNLFSRAGRRRASLLATSSIVAASLMTGVGGMTLLPSIAFADVSCAPDASGGAINSTLEICAGPGSGITYTSSTTPTTVSLGTGVVGVTATTTGVDINAGANNITLEDTVQSSITSTFGNGIQQTTTGGVANVIDFTNGTTVSGIANGILAQSTGSGSIAVTTNGAVQGDIDDGIQAVNSGSGSVSVTTDVGATVSSGGAGIDAESVGSGVGGPVTVTAGDTVTGNDGQGVVIARSDGAGPVVVNTASVVDAGGGAADGILAEAGSAVTGGGGVSVTTAAGSDITGVTLGWGILAQNLQSGVGGTPATGDVVVTTNGNDSSGGIFAGNGSTTGLVTVTANGLVTDGNGATVEASGAGGLVDVEAGTKGVGGGTLTGHDIAAIFAANSGTGGVTVVTGAADNIVDTNAGGIIATSSGTAGNVLVTQGADIGAAGAGKGVGGTAIDAEITNTASTGGVTVNSNANIYDQGGNGSAAIQAINDATGLSSAANGVTVNATTGATVDPVDYFMNISVASGTANVTTNDVSTTDTGIVIKNSGSGNSTVFLTGGSITTLGGGTGTGDGIDVTNTGLGAGVIVGDLANPLNTTINAFHSGIVARGQNDVEIYGNAATTITGQNGVGVSASSTGAGSGGNVAITLLDTGNVVTGGTDGIDASTQSGTVNHTVNVTVDGEITAKGGVGVNVSNTGTSAGQVTIDVNGVNSNFAGGGDGIKVVSTATAASGVGVGVNIDGTGVVTSEGDGINVSDTGGHDTITTTGAVTASAGSGVIDENTATALGAGTLITINTTAGAVTATGGPLGVEAVANGTAGGSLSVTTGAVTQSGVAGLGVVAVTKAGTVQVDTTAGTVQAVGEGLSLTGVVEGVTGDDSLVTIKTAGVTETGGASTASSGIFGSSIGGGVQVTVSDGSTITIPGVSTGFGIEALNAGGAGSVVISTGKGSAIGGGINASNTSTAGLVTVTDTGSVNDQSAVGHGGIVATGAGGQVFVDASNATGPITSANGDGIAATNSGSGGVLVETGAAAKISAGVNGIVAQETDTTGAGGVTVTQDGDIGATGGGKAVGDSGIIAQVTNAGDSGAVLVTSNANIYAGGLGAGTTYGIEASTVGAGAVTIDALSGKTIDPATVGMSAAGNGGAAEVDTNDNITADIGIQATNHGAAGTITVLYQTGNILALGGNGIEANTTGHGAIFVGTASTLVTGIINATPSAGSDGIQAEGRGNVTIDLGAATVEGNDTGGFGVNAGVNVSTLATAAVTVNATGSTVSGGSGIFAFNNNAGAGNTVTVNTDAATHVTSNAGNGIDARGSGGLVTVLNNGSVNATGGAGIEATNHNGASTDAGSVVVNGAGAITVNNPAGGAGIFVQSDLGNETVGNLGGGYTGAIDNKDNADGIQAQIIVAASTGNISVTTGTGGTIGTAAGDSTNDGILATTVGLGSVTVSAGDNIGSLTNNRVNGDGIDAEINNAANLNNLSVTTGGAVSIASVGDGVFATTNGLGNVAVTQLTGTGTINSSTGVGIHATDTAGKGTGTVTVSTSGKVTTLANTAVIATSNTNGDVTVDQGATGIISATGGDGIDASETGGKNGNVIVDLKGSTTASGIGVFATTNTNDDVTVTAETGSNVVGGSSGLTNDGILATDTSGKDGHVTVNVLGNAFVVAFGNGVEVNSNGPGAIAVNTDVGTLIDANGDGILADENYAGPGHSDDLVVTADGRIVVVGVGIDAEVTSATNNAAINVTAGKINALSTGNGITANTIGGGNVTVTTNAGGDVRSGGGDGIDASSSGGNGNVEVINNGTVEGDPGIVITAVGTGTATEIANASVTGTLDAIQITSVDGLNTTQINGAGTTISSTGNGDGIDAKTTGNGSISISTATGTAVAGGSGTVFDANAGIFAKVGGAGTIGIEVAGSVTTQVPHTSFGIAAIGNGGLVSVTLDPTGQVLDGGILATNTTTAPGNGNVDVTLNGGSTVNTSSGDAVAVTTDAGAINVQAGAGTSITADKGLELFGDGIFASTVSGATTINDQGSILATTAGDAIGAFSGSGAIGVTTGAGTITGATDGIVTSITSGAAATTITTGSGLVTGTTGFGIDAVTGGTGAITVTTGPVTGKTGIFTSTNGAGVTNITTTGTVTGTGLDGIDATDNAGSGAITITTAAVSAALGTDVKATSTGGGNIIVTTNGALTGLAGVSATTTGSGSVNVHTKSTVTATVAVGISAVAESGGSTVTTDGLVTGVGGIFASSTGAGSTAVTVNGGVDGTTGAGGIGVNASSATGNVTVAANGGAADTITGTTGVSTNTGGAGVTTITTTGLVTGTTADGIDATTTGSGLITVDTGAVTAAAGTGIKVSSTTGAANIVIDSTGPVNGVAGISANNAAGAGSINITDVAVTATGGIGINATAGSGGVIVTANGAVGASGGVGINATAAGAGTVQVITGAAGSVTSTTAGGIVATGVTGPVIVTTNNKVTGATNGIVATTGGAGTINIDTVGGGLVTGNAGDGIDATDNSGQILIQTGAVTGGGNGISASGVTAPITIITNGAITGGNASDGIKAVTAGAGTIQLDVLTGAVSAGTGIFTAQTGSGVTNIVDSLAANTITGTNGDGIQSVNGAGTGAVNVGGGTGSRIEAAVSGATNGIDISGAGPMNVFTDANVTGGAGWGVKAVSTAAPVTVNVTTGTIQGTATGGKGGGIFAQSSSGATNAVSVTSTTTIIGLGAGSDGIDARDNSTGNVSVADTGPSVTGANDAIHAVALGGTITVGTTAAPITSVLGDGTTKDAAIHTFDTSGATTINTAVSASMAADANAKYGIDAVSATGQITIVNAAAIGASGAGNGVNTDGIKALSFGANTAGISITNSGAIWVDTGGFAGIEASNAGTGLVSVTNAGVIDPGTYGIFTQGGGPVNITNTANVTGTLTALFAKSTGGGVVTVTSNGAAATLTGTTGDGIDAFSTGAGAGSVTVGVSNAAPITSNITAGVNGVDAEGNGVVGVWTAGTINGTTGTGIIAKSTSGTAAGATVTVSNAGAISDAKGILASTTGTNAGDTVTVTVGANVTSTAGNGVEADGVNGLTSIALNAGDVNATGGDGLRGTSSGTGGVTITTASATDVFTPNATAFNDISAITTGAAGDINVTVAGSLNAAGYAGNDAIFAQVNNAASTSNINVSTVNAGGGNGDIWGTHDAIEATSNGLGAITVNAGGGETFAFGNGIVATATNAADTKNVTVNVTGAGNVEGDGVGGEAILASTAGTGNVVVTVANGEAVLEESGAAGSGIIATNSGTAGNVTVTTGDGTIGEAGELIGTDGINAQITNAANSGSVTVTNASTILMANGSDAGIKAISAGAGTVTVTNSGVIDPAAYGIYAKSGGNVVVGDSASITALTGIHAQSTGASSTVSVFQTNPAATILAKNGNGIEASTSGIGTVSVGTSGSRIEGDVTAVPPSVLTTTDGIVATGNGSVQVWTGTGTITGGSTAASWGIKAASGAGALAGAATTVDTEGHVTAAGGIAASNTGTLGTDTVSVNSTGTGAGPVVNGALDDGVQALSNAGAITVTASVSNGTAIGTAVQGRTNGVDAASTGGGAITVTTSGNITGVVGFGIGAVTTGGSGSVGVTTNDQAGLLPAGTLNTVSGQTFGITAASTGTGSTTVTNNTLVVATGTGTAAAPSALNGGFGPVGIEAVGGTGGVLGLGLDTGVTVNVNANVTAAGGRGIVTSSANNAVIDIAAGVTVKGLGDATTAFGGPAADTATHAVVDVSSVTGAVTTLNNAGTIESVNGPSVSSYGDLAITAATTGTAGATVGGVTINNAATGTILGRLELQGETKSDNVIVTNAGTWHTTGKNNIGTTANKETITNSGFIGTADNSAATLLAFGAGTNTVTNAATGVIVLGEAPLGGVISGTPATPAVTTITGTVTFNNNGVIIMGNAGGSKSASDGLIDSTLQAAGTTLGGTGLIDLDANLWSDTQSAAACASSALTAADCLVIGASAGTEGIRVTDTKAHALGAFNPVGIAIVDGATNAGANFALNSGSTWFNPGGTNQFGGATNVLDKPGLFFYDLAYNAADKTERLIGVPKAAAFEFATAGGAANDLWYATTQTWFDRQADLRDGIDGKAVGSGPGVWLKMIGDWSQRDHNDVYSDLNKTYVFNVTYDQDTAAIIGGLDLLNVTHKNEAWVVGVDGGSVDSSIDFRASPDRFHLSGANVGGYATYMNGGLYVDGTINANLLNMQVSLPQLQTTPNPWTASDHVQSFGGQVEAGYTMPMGDMLFWEPLGIVSYANTTLSPLAVPGGVQKLGDDDSFRASLGARVGATADFQYYKVKLTITGRVWDEFSNDTLSTLIVPGGQNFLNNDNLKGVFGDISGQVNLFTLNSGLSAFVTGGVKFKSSYTEGTMTLGARYQF